MTREDARRFLKEAVEENGVPWDDFDDAMALLPASEKG
ncbi:MAG: hypothetical protein BWY99_01131 [Synergistetes bacterium ADurb.BinA166]|mgnify:FL=1|jgi:hypothetical protein|nr:MAG: hypothetical protein BWY99_01131 [Synergistetes bacterium ADurb.BinA166]